MISAILIHVKTQSLKYQRFKPSGWKDIRIRKLVFYSLRQVFSSFQGRVLVDLISLLYYSFSNNFLTPPLSSPLPSPLLHINNSPSSYLLRVVGLLVTDMFSSFILMHDFIFEQFKKNMYFWQVSRFSSRRILNQYHSSIDIALLIFLI